MGDWGRKFLEPWVSFLPFDALPDEPGVRTLKTLQDKQFSRACNENTRLPVSAPKVPWKSWGWLEHLDQRIPGNSLHLLSYLCVYSSVPHLSIHPSNFPWAPWQKNKNKNRWENVIYSVLLVSSMARGVWHRKATSTHTCHVLKWDHHLHTCFSIGNLCLLLIFCLVRLEVYQFY